MSLNRFCHFGGWSSDNGPRRWLSRPARESDRKAWEGLFEGYCDFYERSADRQRLDRVWDWIEAGTVRCLLVVPVGKDEATAVGLAHLRPSPSPLRGTLIGYLDDLFIAPSARGTGAFEALIAGMRSLAAEEDWDIVRWITAADNGRARAAYDRVASRTDWITYQLDV